MRRSALLASLTALYVLSSISAAWAFNDCDNYYRSCRGFVIPCSLDGVNPAYHPSIFGNPTLPDSNMDSSDRPMGLGMSRRTACAVHITAVEGQGTGSRLTSKRAEDLEQTLRVPRGSFALY
jgi:hypothetical protein